MINEKIDELLKCAIDIYEKKKNYGTNNIISVIAEKKWINNDTKKPDRFSEIIRMGIERYLVENHLKLSDLDQNDFMFKIDADNNTLRKVYHLTSIHWLVSESGIHSIDYIEFKEIVDSLKDYDGRYEIIQATTDSEPDIDVPSIKNEWYDIYFYDKTETL